MHLWTSTSMQMIDHKVGNLVSAINKPKNQWENKGKVEEMRCSSRQDERHEKKTAKQDFRKLFANSSQPLRISQCVGNQFRIAKFNSPSTLYLCEIRLSQNLSEISHCEFRKPLCEFRKPLCQIRNPLPNSQTHCQIRKPLCQIH